ncbi:MAG: hypothetical protein GY811_14360 [Myxococcales bacterium]|nr:hypothetical protein [Myxococcales bacterium]
MDASSSGTGRVRFGPDRKFTGAKVFSATMMADRTRLGDVVTDWIHSNPSFHVREIIVTQSSDEAFHCLSMTVFYFDFDA